MPSLQVLDSGLVYRNPKPHLRAIHAMHPSISRFEDGELVATFDIGQGPESMDYHTVLSRSQDEGRTWRCEGPLIKPPRERPTTHTIRTSRLADERLVGLGGLFHRDDPEEGLTNRENLGYVPTDLFTVESRDRGRSWSPLRLIHPPLPSPAWEICHPIRELPNGDLYAPVSAWRGWDGRLPCGEQSGLLISLDGGVTWPLWARSFDGRETGQIHWEQSVVCLENGHLLAVAWVYDPKSGQTLPSEYTTSRDFGRTFGTPRATGFLAQTCKLVVLPGNRVLAAYRRHDRPGLWASLARIEGGHWTNLTQEVLWQGATSGMEGKRSGSDELSGLHFGFPSMQLLPDGDVLLVFWCQEDCIKNIRWIRIRALP